MPSPWLLHDPRELGRLVAQVSGGPEPPSRALPPSGRRDVGEGQGGQGGGTGKGLAGLVEGSFPWWQWTHLLLRFIIAGGDAHQG